MLYQIVAFLLNTVFGLLVGACLLRLYMQRCHVPFGNPVGRFVMALSDWLVLPLRRLMPSVAGWDSASLLAALLLALLHQTLLLAGLGVLDELGAGVAWVLVRAAFSLVHLALNGLLGLVLVYAILSWTRTDSAFADVIERLCAPPLSPIRRVMPLIGGMDLSPLVLLVGVQVLQMLLDGAQQAALRALL